MPSKQVVSDEVLARALGMYAGMVGQVLNNPQRWLGVDEDPPHCWPARPGPRCCFATAPSATSHPPRRTGQPDSKRAEWWIRRIAVGAALNGHCCWPPVEGSALISAGL
jgi:hypothetical protein